MAYSNFTLDTVLEAFDLEEVDAATWLLIKSLSVTRFSVS